MTRKDYIEIANAINENTMNDTQPIINKTIFIKDLCVVFKCDNSLFNDSKFIEACNKRQEV